MSLSRRVFLKKSATVSAVSAATLMGLATTQAMAASDAPAEEPKAAPRKGDRKAPAFILVDDKGNDLYKKILGEVPQHA